MDWNQCYVIYKKTVEELKKVGLKHVAKKGASEVQKERIKTGDGKLEVET